MSTEPEIAPAKNPRDAEARVTFPVYKQMGIFPESAIGCDLVMPDGRRLLDMYGGHAVAALGYGHPALVEAINQQSRRLMFQSNAVALELRAQAAEALTKIAPASLSRAFFVNSGAEANENALRMAFFNRKRKKVLAISHGFHGRSAAASAVTWGAKERWYGFPNTPFEVDFIPRNDIDAAHEMIDSDTAAVIFEPIQGVAGAFDLAPEFVSALRQATRNVDSLLIADEVQSGMGRSGQYFAVDVYGIEPDLLTTAKSLGGGFPCGAVLATEKLARQLKPGDLGTTFGGGPMAVAVIKTVIGTIRNESLLKNVRAREAQIREQCVCGPVKRIQGMGLLLGLVCDRPATEVLSALQEHDILCGSSADSDVVRLLPPLVLQAEHVDRLASALTAIAPQTD